MAPSFAVLGFLNSDGSLGFAQTGAPVSYVARLRIGDYTTRWIEQRAALRWAVPTQTREEAIELRDHWNSASVAQVIREVPDFSVPAAILRQLNELADDCQEGESDRVVEDQAIRLIADNGEFAIVDAEAFDEGQPEPPSVCPFIPLPEPLEPSTFSLNQTELGIKLAIFDLDETLVNSSMLKEARDARDWAQVHRRIEEIRPLLCWGGCAPHQLPGLLDKLGVHIALVSRARRSYVDAVVGMFDIYADSIDAPCGQDKVGVFEQVMSRYGASPAETVVFGDDQSDFHAASQLQILSLGNPWTYALRPATAPDVAWIDARPLLKQGGWQRRLSYIGEAEPGQAEWHRGSLLISGEDAFALGRYFPRNRYGNAPNHDLSRAILAGKSNLAGDPLILSAFRTAIQHLAARVDIDVVLSVPPHPGKADRFGPYRQIVTEAAGSHEDLDVRQRADFPRYYRRLTRAEKREMRQGRFEIGDDLDGMTVVLIDDVVTTGSTIGALKDAAEQAGASRVIRLAFAHTQD